jgi:hypothetical protein
VDDDFSGMLHADAPRGVLRNYNSTRTSGHISGLPNGEEKNRTKNPREKSKSPPSKSRGWGTRRLEFWGIVTLRNE